MPNLFFFQKLWILQQYAPTSPINALHTESYCLSLSLLQGEQTLQCVQNWVISWDMELRVLREMSLKSTEIYWYQQ